MKSVESNFNRLLTPRVAIEAILASPLVLWGLYTLTPFYHEQQYGDTWSRIFYDKHILVTAAAFYIIVGCVTLVSVVFGRRRLGYCGIGGTFFCYAYMTIAKGLVSGTTHAAYWIFYATLALVAAVCYLWERTDGGQ